MYFLPCFINSSVLIMTLHMHLMLSSSYKIPTKYKIVLYEILYEILNPTHTLNDVRPRAKTLVMSDYVFPLTLGSNKG